MKIRNDPIVNRAFDLPACSAVSLEDKNWTFIHNVSRFHYLNGLYTYREVTGPVHGKWGFISGTSHLEN